MLSARKFIDKVNSGDTLTQEELFPLFAQCSSLVMDCIRLLILENSYVQSRILDLGAEVASNLDRNKAIYRRSVAYIEDTLKDVPADNEAREANFLSRCMDLQLAMLNDDKQRQLEIVLSLPLTRMVFEQILTEWYSMTEGYVDASISGLKATIAEDFVAASKFDSSCNKIELDSGLEPRTAFGVVRYIGLRIKSLRKIYDRIFEAYARVIFKQAKSQAISEDHSLDCYQNGSFGLLRAVSSYDHISNARFVGHARWWIRQRMLLHLKEDSNIIKVSSNTWQHYSKLEDVRRKHESKRGPLDNKALSTLSGYSEGHISSIYGMVRASQVRSLDHPLKTATLASFIEAPPDSSSVNELASDSVKILLKNLPTDLRNMVCLSFGLTEYVDQHLDSRDVQLEKENQTL
tara:strand:+ start:2492 stop:3706 length:1215 start_codon:yes stop_codon:yes gene_type:complete